MATATLKARKRSSDWRFKRWTREEFYHLCESGKLGREPSFLVNGRIIVMPMPGPAHDYCLYALIEYFAKLIPLRHSPRYQSGLGVGKRTDPGPDYSIVAGNYRDYVNDTPSAAIFVAEIAVSSRNVDLTLKPGIYAKAGVPEYWVIDVDKRCVVVHRDAIVDDAAPLGGRYASITTYGETDSLAPHFATNVTIRVADLLPPASA